MRPTRLADESLGLALDTVEPGACVYQSLVPDARQAVLSRGEYVWAMIKVVGQMANHFVSMQPNLLPLVTYISKLGAPKPGQLSVSHTPAGTAWSNFPDYRGA